MGLGSSNTSKPADAPAAPAAVSPRAPPPAEAPREINKLVIHQGSRKFMETSHSKTGQIVLFDDNVECALVTPPNKRCERIIVNNCHQCVFQVQDSCVVATKTLDCINLTRCKILVEVADVRILRFHNCQDCIVQVDDYPTLTENFTFYWLEGCKNIKFERVTISTAPRSFHHLDTVTVQACDVVLPGQGNHRSILRDGLELVTTPDDTAQPTAASILQDVERWKTEKIMTDPHEYDEIVEEAAIVEAAAKRFAAALRAAKHCVVYTGAGISTAAKLPDFRGPQGAWTLRDQGKHAEGIDVTMAVPTFAHYALTELHRQGLIKLVVSTNMDGLHRRSGLPRTAISELHGNTYREVCATCQREYIRNFSVSDTVINMRSHITGRKCDCGGPLKDTIIHFTENMPKVEWGEAVTHARRADLALVFGTSMFVHPAASLPDKVLRNNAQGLVIVNLQRTPFDSVAGILCHARCDDFLRAVTQELGIAVKETPPLRPEEMLDH